jgi:uroporphyrinogen-III synthase
MFDDRGPTPTQSERNSVEQVYPPNLGVPSRLSVLGLLHLSITMGDTTAGKIPVLLLKTKSTPIDGYEELFLTCDDSKYEPVFVPVLEHRFKEDALDQVRRWITERAFLPGAGGAPSNYGAIIFTSQRAVEAFTKVVEDVRNEGIVNLDELLPETVPLYVVGPATARGLRALKLRCPILGQETGNGESLASFMLEHYNRAYPSAAKPPILFLVGDKRRDIIPKTLQSDDLPREKRARVDELVIYETGEMHSFKSNFSALWKHYSELGRLCQWVVVFSPTGCRAMLESLGLLNHSTGKAMSGGRSKNILVATIGPTTRDYLLTEFNFSPEVCAAKPSPEGIADGIRSFN